MNGRIKKIRSTWSIVDSKCLNFRLNVNVKLLTRWTWTFSSISRIGLRNRYEPPISCEWVSLTGASHSMERLWIIARATNGTMFTRTKIWNKMRKCRYCPPTVYPFQTCSSHWCKRTKLRTQARSATPSYLRMRQVAESALCLTIEGTR